MSTPFASSSQQNDKLTQRGVEMTATPSQEPQSRLASSKSYKLVKSPTGNNLYVENAEYDPYEHHNKRSEKGEGLLGTLFFCCAPKVKEPAHTAERHYSIAQSPSMDNIANKAD